MPLRFDLSPFEEIYIGKSVIKNGHERANFLITGDTPILKAKDVLTVANTPTEKLYYCVQQMYLEDAMQKYQGLYLRLRVEVVEETRELRSTLEDVHVMVLAGQFYKALRSLRKLVNPSAFVVNRQQPEAYIPRVDGHKVMAG
ncbi:flagellar protein FlbT [Bradyrhizobium sp. USDA 4341]